MADYSKMLESLGMDLETHDQLCEVLPQAFGDVFLSQENRPEAMDYYNFVIAEIHGVRPQELIKAQEEGKKVFGTFCVYVPDELIFAANAIATGLCGGSQFWVPGGEKVLPTNTCPLIKASVGARLDRTCPFFRIADMYIGETTCDGKKKAWEILGEDVPVHVMDLPQMKREKDIKAWAEEIKELKKVIEEFTSGGFKVEVLEYEKLLGLSNASMAQQIYFMEQQHIHVRQIALYLNNEKVTIERGAMSYFQGNIEMVSGGTLGNALGKLVRGAVTGEQMAQPEYSGTGLLVLEPSFKHFLVLELAANESIIVDDGMFYCAQGSVSVKVISQRNLSSAVAGGESFFQQQLTGPGIVILESTVPMSEVDIIDLENDTLKVDGNFAVLRSSTLDFTVERSAKTLMGSAVSGEGLVNVYRGTGQVWLAPTIKVYDTLDLAQMLGLSSTKSMNMITSHSKVK